jgi:hypothetical protein
VLHQPASWQETVLLQQFLCGPDAVVNGMPRKVSLDKFPKGNSVLPTFFNAYAAGYPWRDKTKTGLECYIRVRGLSQNQGNRQHALALRDPTDTRKAEDLFAV